MGAYNSGVEVRGKVFWIVRGHFFRFSIGLNFKRWIFVGCGFRFDLWAFTRIRGGADAAGTAGCPVYGRGGLEEMKELPPSAAGV